MKLCPARLTALLLSLWAPFCWSGVGQQAFDQGMSAYRAGQFQQALQYFLHAQKEGNASDQLHYNLGVTYYRLGNYPAAQAAFEELTHHVDQAPLAHYNLGLVALKTDNPQQARAEFERAQQTTDNTALRNLATEQLRRLSGESALHSPSSRLLGFVNIGTGYDSNVALSPDTGLVTASQRSSSLLSLLAGGRTQLTGDNRNGLQLAGSYYGVAYPGLSQDNLNYLRLGPQYGYGAGGWHTLVGISGGYFTFGGKTLETLGMFSVQGTSKLGSNQELLAEYRYDHIVGGSGYDNLSGWRQSFKIEDTWTPGAASLSGGYRLELNRRNDLTREPEFFSASPTRNRPFVTVGWKFSDLTRSRLGLEYEHSRYNKTNQILQGGTLMSIDRVDQRYTATLELAHKFAPGWSLVGQYRYLDNKSNVVTNSYTSHRVELRVEHPFP